MPPGNTAYPRPPPGGPVCHSGGVPRIESTAARLARLGFADAATAARLVEEAGVEQGDLLDALADVADPDLALASLTRLAEREPAALDRLRADDTLRERVVAVLGVSAALGDHLVRHPDHLDLLAMPSLGEPRAALLTAVGADPGAKEPRATGETALTDLRVAYRGRLAHLAARDLTGRASLQEVTAE